MFFFTFLLRYVLTVLNSYLSNAQYAVKRLMYSPNKMHNLKGTKEKFLLKNTPSELFLTENLIVNIFHVMCHVSTVI